MDILGSIGKLYTFVLLVLLFLGSGLAVWAGINFLINRKDKVNLAVDKVKVNIYSVLKEVKNIKNSGGIGMKNNGFMKLAVFSFVGIIISAAILMALPKYNSNSMSNMNYNQSAYGMNMQGNAYGQNNMNMQSMANYSMQGNMNSNVDMNSIQQQLYSMQQQINQIQNQINSSYGMQNSSSMNNNSMNSNMNSNMNSGSMNNSNMNNSNMNSSNMNNSNMNSSSGSSSMSMM